MVMETYCTPPLAERFGLMLEIFWAEFFTTFLDTFPDRLDNACPCHQRISQIVSD